MINIPITSTSIPWKPPFYSVSISLTILDTTCKWYIIFFVLWLNSLSIMPSSSIHIVTNGRISILLKLIYILYLCIYIIFFIPLFTDEHLNCTDSLGIVNNTAVNMRVQISFWDLVFNSIGNTLSGITRTYYRSVFNFWENLHAFFHSGCTCIHSYQQ